MRAPMLTPPSLCPSIGYTAKLKLKVCVMGLAGSATGLVSTNDGGRSGSSDLASARHGDGLLRSCPRFPPPLALGHPVADADLAE